jgi:hypothetical protein
MNVPVIDLDTAVAAGIITREQADAVLALNGARKARRTSSYEPLPFMTSFAEIFIALGLVILFWGFRGFIAFGIQDHAPAATAAAAVLAWLMAEVFARTRRSAVAAIVCVIASAAFAGSYALGAKLPGELVAKASIFSLPVPWLPALVLAAAIARFLIPFLVWPLGAYLATMALSLSSNEQMLAGLFGIGIVSLSAAIALDRRDPTREGRAGQFAFWLFVVGSPLTVHAAFISIITWYGPHAGGKLIFVLVPAILAVTLAGLVLDRRPPVVSTLAYVGVLFAYYAAQPWLALIALGAYVVLIGTAWPAIRSAMFARLPLLTRLAPDRA